MVCGHFYLFRQTFTYTHTESPHRFIIYPCNIFPASFLPSTCPLTN